MIVSFYVICLLACVSYSSAYDLSSIFNDVNCTNTRNCGMIMEVWNYSTNYNLYPTTGLKTNPFPDASQTWIDYDRADMERTRYRSTHISQASHSHASFKSTDTTINYIGGAPADGSRFTFLRFSSVMTNYYQQFNLSTTFPIITDYLTHVIMASPNIAATMFIDGVEIDHTMYCIYWNNSRCGTDADGNVLQSPSQLPFMDFSLKSEYNIQVDVVIDWNIVVDVTSIEFSGKYGKQACSMNNNMLSNRVNYWTIASNIFVSPAYYTNVDKTNDNRCAGKADHSGNCPSNSLSPTKAEAYCSSLSEFDIHGTMLVQRRLCNQRDISRGVGSYYFYNGANSGCYIDGNIMLNDTCNTPAGSTGNLYYDSTNHDYTCATYATGSIADFLCCEDITGAIFDIETYRKEPVKLNTPMTEKALVSLYDLYSNLNGDRWIYRSGWQEVLVSAYGNTIDNISFMKGAICYFTGIICVYGAQLDGVFHPPALQNTNRIELIMIENGQMQNDNSIVNLTSLDAYLDGFYFIQNDKTEEFITNIIMPKAIHLSNIFIKGFNFEFMNSDGTTVNWDLFTNLVSAEFIKTKMSNFLYLTRAPNLSVLRIEDTWASDITMVNLLSESSNNLKYVNINNNMNLFKFPEGWKLNIGIQTFIFQHHPYLQNETLIDILIQDLQIRAELTSLTTFRMTNNNLTGKMFPLSIFPTSINVLDMSYNGLYNFYTPAPLRMGFTQEEAHLYENAFQVVDVVDWTNWLTNQYCNTNNAYNQLEISIFEEYGAKDYNFIGSIPRLTPLNTDTCNIIINENFPNWCGDFATTYNEGSCSKYKIYEVEQTLHYDCQYPTAQGEAPATFKENTIIYGNFSTLITQNIAGTTTPYECIANWHDMSGNIYTESQLRDCEIQSPTEILIKQSLTMPKTSIPLYLSWDIRIPGYEITKTVMNINYLKCCDGSTLLENDNVCTDCDAGMYSRLLDTNGLCIACPTGSYAIDKGSSMCSPCDTGHYCINSNRAGDSCPEGTFQNEPAQEFCYSCEDVKGFGFSNNITGSVTVEDCQCGEGYYSNIINIEAPYCELCPENANCDGGNSLPSPSSGWWTSSSDPYTVLECFPSEACIGGDSDACAPGYQSFACGECQTLYYRLGDTCRECPENNGWQFFVIVLLLLIFALLVLRESRPSEVTMKFACFKIAVGYLQIISLFYVFPVNWPASSHSLFFTISLVNFNIDLMSPECAVEMTYFDKYFMKLLSPLFILLFWGLLYIFLTRSKLGKRFFDCAYAKDSDENTELIKRRFLYGIGTFASLFYTFLSSTVIEPWNCLEQPSGIFVMRAEASIVCYEGIWADHQPITIVFFILYCLLIPITLGVLMMRHVYKKGKSILLDQHFRSTYGSYTMYYREQYYYWEVVDFCRKLLLILIIQLGSSFNRHEFVQISAVMMVSIIFILLQVYISPYEYLWNNRLAFTWQLYTLFVLFTALIFANSSNEADGVLFGGLLIIGMIIASSFTILTLYQESKRRDSLITIYQKHNITTVKREQHERNYFLGTFPEFGAKVYRRLRTLEPADRIEFLSTFKQGMASMSSNQLSSLEDIEMTSINKDGDASTYNGEQGVLAAEVHEDINLGLIDL